MKRFTQHFSSQLPAAGARRRGRGGSGGERGYVLLVIVAMAAVLAAVIYKVIPQYAFEAKRDREEELIFRGKAYQKAIQLYVRKFGKYPASLDELVNTNNTKFIRKLYTDPMTEEGEWRLIHVGPGGTFPDSKITGSGGEPGKLGTLDTVDITTKDPAKPGDITERSSTDRDNPNRPTGPTFGGGAIGGVASMSEEPSIRIFQDQQSYDLWEFVFDCKTDPLTVQGPACQQQPNPTPTPNPNPNPNPGPGPGRQGFPGFQGFPGGGPPPGFGVAPPPGINNPGGVR